MHISTPNKGDVPSSSKPHTSPQPSHRVGDSSEPLTTKTQSRTAPRLKRVDHIPAKDVLDEHQSSQGPRPQSNTPSTSPAQAAERYRLLGLESLAKLAQGVETQNYLAIQAADVLWTQLTIQLASEDPLHQDAAKKSLAMLAPRLAALAPQAKFIGLLNVGQGGTAESTITLPPLWKSLMAGYESSRGEKPTETMNGAAYYGARGLAFFKISKKDIQIFAASGVQSPSIQRLMETAKKGDWLAVNALRSLGRLRIASMRAEVRQLQDAGVPPEDLRRAQLESQIEELRGALRSYVKSARQGTIQRRSKNLEGVEAGSAHHAAAITQFEKVLKAENKRGGIELSGGFMTLATAKLQSAEFKVQTMVAAQSNAETLRATDTGATKNSAAPYKHRVELPAVLQDANSVDGELTVKGAIYEARKLGIDEDKTWRLRSASFALTAQVHAANRRKEPLTHDSAEQSLKALSAEEQNSVKNFHRAKAQQTTIDLQREEHLASLSNPKLEDIQELQALRLTLIHNSVDRAKVGSSLQQARSELQNTQKTLAQLQEEYASLTQEDGPLALVNALLTQQKEAAKVITYGFEDIDASSFSSAWDSFVKMGEVGAVNLATESADGLIDSAASNLPLSLGEGVKNFVDITTDEGHQVIHNRDVTDALVTVRQREVDTFKAHVEGIKKNISAIKQRQKIAIAKVERLEAEVDVARAQAVEVSKAGFVGAKISEEVSSWGTTAYFPAAELKLADAKKEGIQDLQKTSDVWVVQGLGEEAADSISLWSSMVTYEQKAATVQSQMGLWENPASGVMTAEDDRSGNIFLAALPDMFEQAHQVLSDSISTELPSTGPDLMLPTRAERARRATDALDQQRLLSRRVGAGKAENLSEPWAQDIHWKRSQDLQSVSQSFAVELAEDSWANEGISPDSQFDTTRGAVDLMKEAKDLAPHLLAERAEILQVQVAAGTTSLVQTLVGRSAAHWVSGQSADRADTLHREVVGEIKDPKLREPFAQAITGADSKREKQLEALQSASVEVLHKRWGTFNLELDANDYSERQSQRDTRFMFFDITLSMIDIPYRALKFLPSNAYKGMTWGLTKTEVIDEETRKGVTGWAPESLHYWSLAESAVASSYVDARAQAYQGTTRSIAAAQVAHAGLLKAHHEGRYYSYQRRLSVAQSGGAKAPGTSSSEWELYKYANAQALRECHGDTTIQSQNFPEAPTDSRSAAGLKDDNAQSFKLDTADWDPVDLLSDLHTVSQTHANWLLTPGAPLPKAHTLDARLTPDTAGYDALAKVNKSLQGRDAIYRFGGLGAAMGDVAMVFVPGAQEAAAAGVARLGGALSKLTRAQKVVSVLHKGQVLSQKLLLRSQRLGRVVNVGQRAMGGIAKSGQRLGNLQFRGLKLGQVALGAGESLVMNVAIDELNENLLFPIVGKHGNAARTLQKGADMLDLSWLRFQKAAKAATTLKAFLATTKTVGFVGAESQAVLGFFMPEWIAKLEKEDREYYREYLLASNDEEFVKHANYFMGAIFGGFMRSHGKAQQSKAQRQSAVEHMGQRIDEHSAMAPKVKAHYESGLQQAVKNWEGHQDPIQFEMAVQQVLNDGAQDGISLQDPQAAAKVLVTEFFVEHAVAKAEQRTQDGQWVLLVDKSVANLVALNPAINPGHALMHVKGLLERRLQNQAAEMGPAEANAQRTQDASPAAQGKKNNTESYRKPANDDLETHPSEGSDIAEQMHDLNDAAQAWLLVQGFDPRHAEAHTSMAQSLSIVRQEVAKTLMRHRDEPKDLKANLEKLGLSVEQAQHLSRAWALTISQTRQGGVENSNAQTSPKDIPLADSRPHPAAKRKNAPDILSEQDARHLLLEGETLVNTLEATRVVRWNNGKLQHGSQIAEITTDADQKVGTLIRMDTGALIVDRGRAKAGVGPFVPQSRGEHALELPPWLLNNYTTKLDALTPPERNLLLQTLSTASSAPMQKLLLKHFALGKSPKDVATLRSQLDNRSDAQILALETGEGLVPGKDGCVDAGIAMMRARTDIDYAISLQDNPRQWPESRPQSPTEVIAGLNKSLHGGYELLPRNMARPKFLMDLVKNAPEGIAIGISESTGRRHVGHFAILLRVEGSPGREVFVVIEPGGETFRVPVREFLAGADVPARGGTIRLRQIYIQSTNDAKAQTRIDTDYVAPAVNPEDIKGGGYPTHFKGYRTEDPKVGQIPKKRKDSPSSAKTFSELFQSTVQKTGAGDKALAYTGLSNAMSPSWQALFKRRFNRLDPGAQAMFMDFVMKPLSPPQRMYVAARFAMGDLSVLSPAEPLFKATFFGMKEQKIEIRIKNADLSSKAENDSTNTLEFTRISGNPKRTENFKLSIQLDGEQRRHDFMTELRPQDPNWANTAKNRLTPKWARDFDTQWNAMSPGEKDAFSGLFSMRQNTVPAKANMLVALAMGHTVHDIREANANSLEKPNHPRWPKELQQDFDRRWNESTADQRAQFLTVLATYITQQTRNDVMHRYALGQTLFELKNPTVHEDTAPPSAPTHEQVRLAASPKAPSPEFVKAAKVLVSGESLPDFATLLLNDKLSAAEAERLRNYVETSTQRSPEPYDAVTEFVVKHFGEGKSLQQTILEEAAFKFDPDNDSDASHHGVDGLMREMGLGETKPAHSAPSKDYDAEKRGQRVGPKATEGSALSGEISVYPKASPEALRAAIHRPLKSSKEKNFVSAIDAYRANPSEGLTSVARSLSELNLSNDRAKKLSKLLKKAEPELAYLVMTHQDLQQELSKTRRSSGLSRRDAQARVDGMLASIVEFIHNPNSMSVQNKVRALYNNRTEVDAALLSTVSRVMSNQNSEAGVVFGAVIASLDKKSKTAVPAERIVNLTVALKAVDENPTQASIGGLNRELESWSTGSLPETLTSVQIYLNHEQKPLLATLIRAHRKAPQQSAQLLALSFNGHSPDNAQKLHEIFLNLQDVGAEALTDMLGELHKTLPSTGWALQNLRASDRQRRINLVNKVLKNPEASTALTQALRQHHHEIGEASPIEVALTWGISPESLFTVAQNDGRKDSLALYVGANVATMAAKVYKNERLAIDEGDNTVSAFFRGESWPEKLCGLSGTALFMLSPQTLRRAGGNTMAEGARILGVLRSQGIEPEALQDFSPHRPVLVSKGSRLVEAEVLRWHIAENEIVVEVKEAQSGRVQKLALLDLVEENLLPLVSKKKLGQRILNKDRTQNSHGIDSDIFESNDTKVDDVTPLRKPDAAATPASSRYCLGPAGQSGWTYRYRQDMPNVVEVRSPGPDSSFETISLPEFLTHNRQLMQSQLSLASSDARRWITAEKDSAAVNEWAPELENMITHGLRLEYKGIAQNVVAYDSMRGAVYLQDPSTGFVSAVPGKLFSELVRA